MSILSIVAIILAIVSLILIGKSKKLSLNLQRVLFFGLFGIIICTIPETMQYIYKLVYDEWLGVVFSSQFDKYAFAQMGAQALSRIIIVGALFIIVWLLWRLYLVISKHGIRLWAAALVSVFIILTSLYAEFFNGIYTFDEPVDFLRLKISYNTRFELLPNKVIFYSNDNPVASKCEAEVFNLFSGENRQRLQLKFDGDVYIWRDTATKEAGFYPLHE